LTPKYNKAPDAEEMPGLPLINDTKGESLPAPTL